MDGHLHSTTYDASGGAAGIGPPPLMGKAAGFWLRIWLYLKQQRMLFTQLELWTQSTSEQRRFYTESLGFSVLTESAEAMTVQAGGTRLVWHHSAQPLSGVYHLAFNIPANQFNAAKAWVAARVPLISNSQGEDEFHFADWDAHAFYFYDAAGNILECITRHTLPNAVEGPFSPQQFLCVSELGLVVEAVPATVKMLTAQLGVTPYRAGSEDFAPVGAETGLLIVVRRGRLWFPDLSQSAQSLPLKATVQNANGVRSHLSVANETFEVSVNL